MTSLRLERRLAQPRWLGVVAPVLAGVVALVITGVVLAVTGQDPFTTYSRMADAAAGSPGAMSATLASATPLILTGLAAAVAFRVKIWNIGGEGQLFAGAMCASAAGFAFGDDGLAIALPAMIAAGVLGGAAWIAIPAFLKLRLHTNEILTTLMFNYLGALLLAYLIFDSHSYWRDDSSAIAQVYPQSKTLADAAFWPGFDTGSVVIPLGFLLGVVLAVGLFVSLRSTRFGFQLRVVADTPAAGRYAGMHTKRTYLLVLLLSAALAGLAGASQVGDFSHTLEPDGLQQATLGYTGIVAAALARFHPLGVVVTALFVGALTNAGFHLQSTEFPLALVGMMNGIILFCVLSSELVVRYRIRVVHPAGAARADDAPAAGLTAEVRS